jgi:radical SAM/Cys-rich protein
MHDTLSYLEPTDFPAITRDKLQVLQVNLGYLCNLSCTHCHVNAGPKRTELMDKATIDVILEFIQRENIGVLDLTGGAPEMNPHFRYLVTQATRMNVAIIDRCNLVILQEPGYESLAGFLAENRVEIVASLPCYLEENVDRQRGKLTFQSCIAALKKLNELGYGLAESDLKLNLVYNPQDNHLPPNQQVLELAYKAHLQSEYGIVFNNLYAMANLPIQRFGSMLISKGLFADYMQVLKHHFRPENLAGLMCKTTLSVDWQGYVYDCDFNQMLSLPMGAFPGRRAHISGITGETLAGKPIAVRQHCYGCTAGQGSSCGGALGPSASSLEKSVNVE